MVEPPLFVSPSVAGAPCFLDCGANTRVCNGNRDSEKVDIKTAPLAHIVMTASELVAPHVLQLTEEANRLRDPPSHPQRYQNVEASTRAIKNAERAASVIPIYRPVARAGCVSIGSVTPPGSILMLPLQPPGSAAATMTSICRSAFASTGSIAGACSRARGVAPILRTSFADVFFGCTDQTAQTRISSIRRSGVGSPCCFPGLMCIYSGPLSCMPPPPLPFM